MLNEISIEIIRKCPNRCLHCSSYSTEKCSEFISFPKFKEIIVGAKKLGLRTVCFSGGEPFLHPNIVEMVEFVDNLGLSSYIYTSGIWMKEDKDRCAIPEKIIKKISHKVTKIIFNIEAAEEKVYDKVMGTQGNFSFLKESILCAVKNGVVVEGHFVPMKINKDQIESTLRLCKELGVSKLSFLRLVIHGRAKENKEFLMLSDEELEDVKHCLLNFYKQHLYSIRIGVPLLGETQENFCEAANGKLNIRYDGLVFPCEVFKNNEVYVLAKETPGNIFEDDIDVIYRESNYLKVVRSLIEQFGCENNCENCVGQYYMDLANGGKKYGK